MRRVGLLGGAFNPPHAGHFRLAQLGLLGLRLDEVRFVPTALSPHKAEPADGLEALTRLKLLQASLARVDLPFMVEPLEIERGGTSYTVDTLETLCGREPKHGWILLLGSDQLAGLGEWRRIDRILELASLAVAPRPGSSQELPEAFRSRVCPSWSGAPGELVWLPSTRLEVSSTVVRRELAEGRESDALPAQVRAAIQRENYYRK